MTFLASLGTLTSMRFFAAAAIVYSHTRGGLLPEFPFDPLILPLGVSFFFVLSGFILTYAYQNRSITPHFYFSRFAKLYPLHFIAGIIWIVVDTKCFHTQFNFGLNEVYFFLLLQAWFPVVGIVFCLNGVAWSISAEIFFYIVFPFLRKKNSICITFFIALIIFITLICFDIFFTPVVPPWTEPQKGEFFSLNACLQFPVMRLLEFCIGVHTGNLFITKTIKSSSQLEFLAVILIILFALTAEPIRHMFQEYGLSHIGIYYNQCGGMFCFAFAIYVFANQKGVISKFLKLPLLVLLGKISFATYLLHVPLSYFIYKYGINNILPNWLTAILYLTGVYMISYLGYKFIEVPVKSVLEKIFKKLYS